jgi:hypothetical protein
MVYKISDTAIIIESDGETILIADSLEYENSITISDTDYTLSPTYIADYFSSFQGSTSGYATGGTGPPFSTVIDKFPFASDANATDVGDLTQTRTNASGQSSADNGYTSGGSPTINTIDKFPFSADANATDVGDLTQGRASSSGQSSSGNGYTSGGSNTGFPIVGTNTIDKFPFSADVNATDVGDLLGIKIDASGQSSTENGYISGGQDQTPEGSGYSNVIQKFPFSADANSTDVGDLTVTKIQSSGQSSSTHGYTSGGPNSNIIEKFSFSTDANATDVGDLTQARYRSAGQSSTENGYASGGYNSGNPAPPPPIQTFDTIDKFSFTSDGNATDVGNLTQARYGAAGQQV